MPKSKSLLPILVTDDGHNPFSPLFWKLMLLFGVVLYGSYSVLIHLCEVNNSIPFSSSSVVFMIETTKLLASTFYSVLDSRNLHFFNKVRLRSCLPFSIPALLYCVNNNVAIHMQIHMDPATFQVLCNLKIISTALLYKIIIKRPITSMQWFALLLLTLAGVSNSYGGLKAPTSQSRSSQDIYITWTGMFLMALYCIISGFAGVYSEYILKQERQMSLSIQNMVLYIYGVLCNGMAYLFTADADKAVGSFFEGYSVLTWMIILSQAASGLIMSVIMKHSSNITRLFFISCAMLVTTALSLVIFTLQLNVYFITACLLVIISLMIYHK